MNEHMENALESIVETIMNFGVYPQPRKVGLFLTSGSRRPTEFDLYDFLYSRIEYCELLEYFIISMNDQTNYGGFADQRNKWDKKVTAMLTEHLKDSDMVRELAEKYAQDAAA